MTLVQSFLNFPYRLFFPLGWLFAMLAVLIWPVYFLGSLSFLPYPSFFHFQWNITFFLSFISGFLMTALPRFTETSNASIYEVGLALALLLFGGISPFFNISYFWFFFMALTLFLFHFCSLRLSKKKINPPSSFIFIFLGLFLALAGGIVEAWKNFFGFSVSWLEGKQIAYHGLMVSSILGAATRLAPGIFGWDEEVNKQRSLYEQNLAYYKVIPLSMKIIFIFLLFSYLGGTCLKPFGAWIRFVGVFWILLYHWKLFCQPKTRTPMARALFGASWFFLIGLGIQAILPVWSIDGEHILFIGGFGMMVLLISSRVILAHGPGKASEKDWFPYYPLLVLAVLTFFFRLFPLFWPEFRWIWLTGAAFSWALVLLLWGVSFLPKICSSIKK